MRKQTILILLGLVLLGAFLRFYQLGTIPHGLYFDEISYGYNALSILLHGVDEHGVSYPLWFQAFGEYKMPIYIYLTALAIKLFGVTDFSIRFFSAFFGTATIISFYFFVRELVITTSFRFKKALPFVAALLLAFSPWHIQFSHAAFEAILAAFFYISGLMLALSYLRTRHILWLILSTISFALTLYSYNGYRPITPLTVFLLLAYAFVKEKKIRAQVAGALAFFIALALPFIQFNLTPAGQARFSQVSAFANNTHAPTLQKLLLIPAAFVHNYFSYFSLNFLFGFGDGVARHQLIDFGPLPYWQLPFILIGMVTLIKAKQPLIKTAAFALLFLAPISAAVAIPSPHTLRDLLMVFPMCMFAGLGLLETINKLRTKPIILGCIALVICYETALYFHTYYGQYAINSAIDWGGEFKQTVAKTQTLRHPYTHIVVDRDLGFAANLYFRYYTNDTISPLVVSGDFTKPAAWGNKPYLLIRPKKKTTVSGMLVDTVYLPNNNKDIFAQFWNMQ